MALRERIVELRSRLAGLAAGSRTNVYQMISKAKRELRALEEEAEMAKTTEVNSEIDAVLAAKAADAEAEKPRPAARTRFTATRRLKLGDRVYNRGEEITADELAAMRNGQFLIRTGQIEVLHAGHPPRPARIPAPAPAQPPTPIVQRDDLAAAKQRFEELAAQTDHGRAVDAMQNSENSRVFLAGQKAWADRYGRNGRKPVDGYLQWLRTPGAPLPAAPR